MHAVRQVLHRPGRLYLVDDKEVKAIAKYLGLSIEELKQKHTRLVDMASLDPAKTPSQASKYKRSLTENPSQENPGDYDCTFLAKDGSCSIYPHRPKQCRTYPFWPEILRSKKTWEDEAHYCEGINHEEAEVVAFPSIEKNLNEQIAYERTHKPSEKP